MLIVALVCCQMTLSKGWLEGTWGGLNGPVPWTPLDTAEETAARLSVRQWGQRNMQRAAVDLCAHAGGAVDLQGIGNPAIGCGMNPPTLPVACLDQRRDKSLCRTDRLANAAPIVATVDERIQRARILKVGKTLASAPDSRTPKSWCRHGFSLRALVSCASRCTFRPVGDRGLVRPERAARRHREGCTHPPANQRVRAFHAHCLGQH